MYTQKRFGTMRSKDQFHVEREFIIDTKLYFFNPLILAAALFFQAKAYNLGISFKIDWLVDYIDFRTLLYNMKNLTTCI